MRIRQTEHCNGTHVVNNRKKGLEKQVFLFLAFYGHWSESLDSFFGEVMVKERRLL